MKCFTVFLSLYTTVAIAIPLFLPRDSSATASSCASASASAFGNTTSETGAGTGAGTGTTTSAEKSPACSGIFLPACCATNTADGLTCSQEPPTFSANDLTAVCMGTTPNASCCTTFTNGLGVGCTGLVAGNTTTGDTGTTSTGNTGDASAAAPEG